MPRCPHCGKTQADARRFCGDCGGALDSSISVTTPPSAIDQDRTFEPTTPVVSPRALSFSGTDPLAKAIAAGETPSPELVAPRLPEVPTQLTARDRARLKARAHALEPIVQIGHSGLTDAQVKEIDRVLTAHELIKVRAGAQDRDERAELFDELCNRTGASPVQQVGKVMVLWRKNPEKDGGRTSSP